MVGGEGPRNQASAPHSARAEAPGMGGRVAEGCETAGRPSRRGCDSTAALAAGRVTFSATSVKTIRSGKRPARAAAARILGTASAGKRRSHRIESGTCTASSHAGAEASTARGVDGLGWHGSVWIPARKQGATFKPCLRMWSAIAWRVGDAAMARPAPGTGWCTTRGSSNRSWRRAGSRICAAASLADARYATAPPCGNTQGGLGADAALPARRRALSPSPKSPRLPPFRRCTEPALRPPSKAR
eukprot:scaffold3808_cov112-Isochrysis_galbana.AAC.44